MMRYGGTVAEDGAYPWFGRTTSSFFSGGVLQFQGSCGASLIHPEYAISAFHCVDSILEGYDFTVTINFGANDYDGGDSVAVRSVQTVFFSENYDFPVDDIVLYKLASPVTNIEPITWNRAASIPTIPSVGKAIGFGLTTDGGSAPSILLEVELDIVDDSVCINFFPPSGQDNDELVFVFTPGKSVCQGDSGGPLVQSETLMGLTSFGGVCGQSPAGFAATSYHEEFIDQVRVAIPVLLNTLSHQKCVADTLR